MSCDGSSAKSYIRHATEKERLDNLAFASFPEDYLPYAATSGHHRVAAPPPYLLWGEDRRRRPAPRRQRPKCAGALLCAIALVVIAILAVVAISVYLGVVTNLFRSPVVSVSGRFTASEDFSYELLNSSSPKFLEKAGDYKAKVEKAFLSSSLEPAFIAARIYSFKPGLVVFFRVYLDRRKLRDEGESPPIELVRELVTQKLTADPESVHVEENEEILSEELRPPETERPPSSTTPKLPTEQQGPQLPPKSGGVGEWRPVPIEDSVSPSFADRPPGVVGSVRSPEEIPRRNPAEGFGSVKVLEESPPRNKLPLGNPLEGVGSVRVLEESPTRNTQLSANTHENSGTVRLLEETSSRSPLLSILQREGVGSASGPEMSSKNPLLSAVQREGVGTVRLLDESSPKTPQLIGNLGVGSVRVLEDDSLNLKLLENPGEGVGSVRLIDEIPKKNSQLPVESRAGVGLVRVLEDTPPRKSPTHGNPSESVGFVRPMDEPPTLAPFVSLVVRNRSRSDRPKNLPTRLAKIEQNSDSANNQRVGVGSIREIITEEGFPLPLQKEPQIIASRLLDLNPETTTSNSPDQNTTEINNDTENQNTETFSLETLTDISSTIHNNKEQVIHNKTTDLKLSDPNLSKNKNSSTKTTSFTHSETPFDEVTTEQIQSQDFKISPLGNILFSQTRSTITTPLDINRNDNFTSETSTESVSLNISITKDEKDNGSSLNNDSTIVTDKSNEKEIFSNITVSSVTENSDEDIHSSIVNYSQYLYPESHYHTIQTESNMSSKEPFEAHTLEGHGFHQPSISTGAVITVTTFKMSSPTTKIPITSTLNSSEENQHSLHTSSEMLQIFSSHNSSGNVSQADPESPEYSLDDSDVAGNSSNSYEIWSEEEEAVNATIDDTSQQAKVVPQLQSDLTSNDIGEEEELSNEGKDPFEDEILRHITTLKPQSSGSGMSVDSCPTGSVPCSASSEKCGVRCDLRRDCPNNEDEEGCTCSDLLRAMGQSQKLCDGVDDCSDGSDEAKCSWCPSSDYFRCPGSRTCITLDSVCDGKYDCPGSQDESRCVTLADSSIEAETFEYRSEGYLIVRKRGRWGKLCLDALTRSSDLDRRITDLGKAVCNALTYRNMSSSMRSTDETESEHSYYQILTEAASNKSSPVTSLFEPTTCKGKEVLKVQCKTLECGLRPSVPTQRRRIVGGKSADSAGSWPWAAALYREGDFQCGAALISDTWLVSAAHCFYSSQHAHWTARLGVLRRGSELASGGEQVRRIKDIILHPQYEDVGFINDIALLRMDQAVPFSDSLRPICLPSSSKEDATLWHGQRCSVVGWGKLYEIGHTFPDSLQEVRLPVISSAECQRRSIFLPAYRITPNMFCAGYDRGGRDACLGDSGGPMACQRPADGRWILLGVTSNGDGCGRPGRPGVYSQVAGFLSWIQETISERKEFSGNAGSESMCTGGVRCRLGRCIQRARVCDGRRDCAGGEDEDDC